MNAREKEARELVESFYEITYKDNRAYSFGEAFARHITSINNGKKGLDSINRAKQCAILACDFALRFADDFDYLNLMDIKQFIIDKL
jgi:hypothetical protein